MSNGVAPGWYPTGVSRVTRWWNGTVWTDHLMVGSTQSTVSQYHRRLNLAAYSWIGIGVVAVIAFVWAMLVIRANFTAGLAFPVLLVGGVLVPLLSFSAKKKIPASGYL